MRKFAMPALCALGCAASGGYEIHPKSGWTIDSEPGATPARDPDYLIVADTHASFPLAPHELLSNTYVVDVVGHAAVRPPQVDMWSDRLLSWILDQRRHAKRVVHLGDAGNIACAAEFRRFLDAVSATDRWIYTPGNHDSLLMGNFADWVVDDRAETRWGRECGQLPVLTKTRLLDMYVDAKHWSYDPESAASQALPKELQQGSANRVCSVINTGEDSVTAIRCDVYRRDTSGGIKRDHGRAVLNDASAFYSFIVQLVADDKHDLLLLDSTDYRKLPKFVTSTFEIRSGGIYGGLSDLQMSAATWLISQLRAKRRYQNPILIGSHFPIDALDEASLKRLEQFVGEESVFAFVGAHAHLPTAGRLHSTVQGNFLELNVGSVAGWPMEYQYLTVDVGAAGDIALSSTVISVARALLQNRADLGVKPYESCALELVRKIPDDSYFGYKHYYRPHGYLKLVRSMFADEDAYLRSIGASAYRSDEELGGLAPEDIAVRLPANLLQMVNRYERCQAVFASAAEDGDVDLTLKVENESSCSKRPKNETTHCQAGFLSKLEDPPPERCECRVVQEGAAAGSRTWHLARVH